MSALDDIRRRVANPLHPAHRTRSMSDRARLLAALDAVLALADVADKRAATNYGEGKLRYEAGDQDASAFQALGLCQTQVAHEIRAAVNDALEADK